MSSTYSPKLRFELVGAGEQAGLWGTTTNKNIGQLIEQAIAGVTTVELDGLSGNYTLTALDGTADQSRSAVIKCTYGSVPAAGAINLIIPTQTKLYVVRNDCGQLLTVKTSGQTGGVELQDGEATLVFCDGTNAILGLETAAAGTLGVDGGGTGRSTFTAGVLYSSGGTNALSTYTSSAAIPVSYGGTGQNTLSSGYVLTGNGTSGVSSVAPGSSGNVLTSNGSAWVSSAPASAGVTSVSGTGTVSGLTLSGTVTSTGSLTLGGTLSLTSGNVTDALGYTPVSTSTTQTITGAKTFTGGATSSSWNFSSTSSIYLTSGAVAVDISSARVATFDDSGGSSRLRLDGSDYGIQSNSSSIQIGYNGGTYLTISGTSSSGTVVSTTSDCQKPGGGSWNSTSDSRLKENVVDYSKSLQALKQLRTVTYNYNDVSPLGAQTEHKTFTGLIAQEVEQTAFAGMVKTDTDGYKSLDSSELVYALINAVKELSAEVDALKAQLNA